MDKNSRKKAIALRYDSHDPAPVVTAKGEGLLAQRIIELAEDLGIPLIKSAKQAEALSQVDLGRSIPPELYQAVAEIYAFLVEIDSKLQDKNI